METGSKINKFEYTMDIHKLSNDSDDLIIAGAVSDATVDLDGESVDQGSLHKAWDKYLKNPVVRLMHDSKIGAIGRVIPEFTDSEGVIHKTGWRDGVPYIVAMISKAPDMESIRTKIREGIYCGLSIGGRGKSVVKNGKTQLMIRDLLEVSVVDIPSNGNSLFAVVKSACIGDNCPITEINEETLNGGNDMDEKDIVEIVEKTISEMKVADDYVVLQKKYDALLASQTDTEVKVKPEIDVIKALNDKVETLTSEIAEMRGTPIQKGVQDGEKVEKSAPTDITSQIVARHYGGA